MDTNFAADGLFQAYSSYVVNNGTWYMPSFITPTTAYSAQANAYKAATNGVVFSLSTIKFSDITDGLSNTMVFSERSRCIYGPGRPRLRRVVEFRRLRRHGLRYALPDQRRSQVRHPDPERRLPDPLHVGRQLPPGGANFAFLDGSVRFIKETIDSWPLDNNTPYPLPAGIAYGTYGESLLGASRPGVYQALSTRNVGEVISADAF